MFSLLRIRYGLFWRRSAPGWAEMGRWGAAILAVAGLLGLMGLVDAVQAATERAIYAEKAALVFEQHAQALKNCEAGASGYYYPDGRMFQCPRPL